MSDGRGWEYVNETDVSVVERYHMQWTLKVYSENDIADVPEERGKVEIARML
jgi:hypothetical protein